MSSFARERPGSPDNTCDRTLTPQDGATDEVRLICVLSNYLQQDLQPLPGRTTGFFLNRSPEPIIIHTGEINNRSELELGYGPFQVAHEKIAFTISALKQDYYRLAIKAVAFDDSGKVVTQKELKIQVHDRQGLEEWWDNLNFAGVMSLFRWKCKVYYESNGERRQEMDWMCWLRGQAPWGPDIDM